MYAAVIIGGGVVGAITALALAQILEKKGHIAGKKGKVALIELSKNRKTANAFRTDSATTHFSKGRLYTLNHASMACLTSVGIHPDSCTFFTHMQVEDIVSDQGFLYIADQCHQQYLGCTVYEQQLLDACYAKLSESTNVAIFSQEIVTVTPKTDGWLCIDKQGDSYHTGWMFVANGATSTIPEAVGIAIDSQLSRDSAISVDLHMDRDDPSHIARQWFGPQGVIAFLPNTSCVDQHTQAGGKTVNLVWTMPSSQCTQFAQLSESAFLATLAAAIGGKAKVDGLVGVVQTFPIRYHCAPQIYKQSAILLGDTACSIYPIAGQGINRAMQQIIHMQRLLDIKKNERVWYMWQNKLLIQHYAWMYGLVAIRKIFDAYHPLPIWARGIAISKLAQADFPRHIITRIAMHGQ